MQNLKTKRPHECRILRYLLFAVLQGMLLWPAVSRAERSLVNCQERPKSASKAKHIAGDLFGRAEKAFAEKQYAKALRRFLCSLYIVEHEATVGNIERVVADLSNGELALRILNDYIELNPEGEFTPRIKDIVLELETELGMTEDEQQDCVEPPPEPAAPPPPVCVSVPDAAPYIAESRSAGKVPKIFGLTTIGVGAASLVLGGVLQGLSAAAKKKADEASSYDAFLNQVERKKQLQAGAVAGFVAGAVTAGIGVAELVISLKRQKALAALEARNPRIEKCGPSETPKAETPAEKDSGTAPPVEKEDEKDKPEAAVTVGLGGLSFGLRF